MTHHSADPTNGPTLGGSPEELVEIRPGRRIALQVFPGGRHADTTVFLCHGAGGNKYQWREQWYALAEAGYRIVAWDLPGHGRSPKPRPGRTYAGAELRADMVELLSRYRSGRNFLLAHSYGVTLSLAALRETAPLDGALLLGAPAPWAGLGGSPLFALPAFVLEWLRPGLARGFRELAWHSEADPALVAFEQGWAERNPMRVFRALVRGALRLDKAKLADLSGPFVLLSGEEDRIAPPAAASELAAALPGARLRILRRCAHQVMLECPEKTNAHLFRLLEGDGSLAAVPGAQYA